MISLLLLILAVSVTQAKNISGVIESVLSDLVNSRLRTNATCKLIIVDTNSEMHSDVIEGLQNIYPTMWISREALKGKDKRNYLHYTVETVHKSQRSMGSRSNIVCFAEFLFSHENIIK